MMHTSIRTSIRRFLQDLDHEIMATPTGPRREALTEAQIHIMALEDKLKHFDHDGSAK